MKYTFLLMAASIGLLAGCSELEQDIADVNSLTDGDLVEKVIFEVLPIKDGDNLETRASAVPNGGTVNFAWEVTDTVGIFPKKGSQVFFSMESGAGTSSANFDGGDWALKQGSLYISYYPLVGEFYLDRTKIPVSFAGQKQMGTSSPFHGARYYLATNPASSENGVLRFSYSTLNTIINVNATLPAGTYTKMSLTTEEPLFVEEGTYSLDDHVIVGTKFTSTLEIELEDVVLTEEGTIPIYIMSAPVDLKDKEVTVTVISSDGKTFGCVKTPSKAYGAGTRYGLTCDKMESEAYNDMEVVNEAFMSKIASHGNAAIYSPLRVLFNYCGDDVYAAGSCFGDNDALAALDEFRFDAASAVVNSMYSNFYDFIRTATSFIDKYQNDLPKILGPARVLRAYAHMMLAIGWGAPPVMDHVYAESELPSNNVLTQKQILEWCAQECEASIANLSERKSPQDKEGAYRVTSGFAQALAGKAYLFAGNYVKAKELLGDVINSGKYALVPGENYWQNFHIEGDGNEEKIFEPNIEYNSSIGSWSGPIQHSTWMEANLMNWRSDHFVSGAAPQLRYTGGVDGWGGLGVPQWFGDEFFANDGHSYRFDATLKHIDDAVYYMDYGDSQITDLTPEQRETSNKVGIADVNNGLYGQSFWLPFKQLMRSSDSSPYGNNVRMNNYTIMRYAEVLLLYAEACLQSGDDAQGTWAVNQIRQRAGLATLARVDMSVLKKEKSYELWLEGCRWPDLVRWGDTDRVKNAGQDVPKLFDKLFREPKSTDQGIKWENGTEADSRFYTVSTHEALDAHYDVGFKTGKHELFPYPTNALMGNPNLAQNPGW